MSETGDDRRGVVHVGARELQALLAEGVPIVDIRTAPEWAQTGVVKGSHLLTFFDALGRHDAPGFLDAVRRVAPADGPVIVICRSGARTIPVSQFLVEAGQYPTVYNVRGGILEWLAEGLPVER
jgi:rhodanese-related sulfurtransferase